jgi:adenine-specific DNA-methyltransferase
MIHQGDCVELLPTLPDGAASLVVASPPYNIGKAYETRTTMEDYLAWHRQVVNLLPRVIADDGHVAWQVGTHVDKGVVTPLDLLVYSHFIDAGFKLRNRIIWAVDHGLHATQRLSGRHETILWFSKTGDYYFDLDSIRIPQKHPGKKHYKGPKKGQLSCNPKGKNPGDVWTIPQLRHNHPQKTDHPCQYPEALIEPLVTALTQPGDLVVDPFAGAGTSLAVAQRLGRAAWGCELMPEYVEIAQARLA